MDVAENRTMLRWKALPRPLRMQGDPADRRMRGPHGLRPAVQGQGIIRAPRSVSAILVPMPGTLARTLALIAYACAVGTVSALAPEALPGCALAAVAALPGRREETSPFQSDAHFRAAVDASPEAILIHSAGRFVYANQAAARLLHAESPERLLGLSPFDLVSTPWQAVARERTQKLGAGEAVPVSEMRWMRLDGSEIDVEVSAAPLRTDQGSTIQVFVRDVTERKQAQRKIERLSSLYHALSQTAHEASHAKSRERLFDEVCRIAMTFGKLQSTWIGLVDRAQGRVVPVAASGPGQGYAQQVLVSLDDAVAEGRGLVAGAIRENRPFICNDARLEPRAQPWLELMLAYGFLSYAVFPLREQGEAIGCITHYATEPGFFDNDLTDLLGRMADEVSQALDRLALERRRDAAEAALREQERRLSTMMGNLPGMVYRGLFDADWTMHFVSEGCVELTGYRADELVNAPVVSYEQLTHPDDRDYVREAIGRALQGHSRYTVEYRIVARDGREKWVWENGLGIYDAHGALVAMEGFIADITEIKRYREQLEHQAQHDTLTGLANRTLLNDRLQQAVVHCQRQRSMLALLFLDLDHFKLINDSLGHSAGDELLKLAANRLAACVREGDTVARLGGDEFVLLLVDQPGAQAVSHAVERVLEAMAQPYRVQGKEFMTTCSVGVSLFPDDGTDGETLLKNADAAMYRAKAAGRNAFHFFTAEINRQLSERLALERDLRRALQGNELILHYQPKVDLTRGTLVGAEALVRWNHPELGMLSPARFIPIAEETGLIVPMGEWILRQACLQVQQWRQAGMDFRQLSVNLSARQFRQRELVEQVARVLQSTGLPAACLDLELTESLMLENVEEYIVRLQALKDLGVQLSVDDFGTGYSSLSYLKRFPVDRLKIDKSFVRDIVSDAGDAAIAQAVIRLGQILGLSVTAEGVETEEQLAFLRRHGCDEAQGYLFSPPLPPDAFAHLWRQGLLAPALWARPGAEFPAVV
jgi:diguanylate cyclase (GGDEF)-like protein/PAS domain S-box-containing protein